MANQKLPPPACENCKFSRHISPWHDVVECRRSAPKLDGRHTLFPETKKNDWCGDHQHVSPPPTVTEFFKARAVPPSRND